MGLLRRVPAAVLVCSVARIIRSPAAQYDAQLCQLIIRKMSPLICVRLGSEIANVPPILISRCTASSVLLPLVTRLAAYQGVALRAH